MDIEILLAEHTDEVAALTGCLLDHVSAATDRADTRVTRYVNFEEWDEDRLATVDELLDRALSQ